jgi:predicted RNase H-like HicB family nuclease
MYRIWYWATIDRESDGRFIASIPDLWDLAAYGDTDKDAVAHVTELAGERVRAAVDDGQPVPPRRHSSEMPSHIRSKEVGRAIIPVEVGRREAWPTPPYHMSAWAQTMAKPLPEKLNPAWAAAVKHMLAIPPHPKKAVKKKPQTTKK